MWDLPGGFVDPDESLEQAVQRELHEELGWQPPPESVRYLGSFPNTYRYDNITYKTCDTVFVVTLSDKPALQAADDVAALYWVKRSELELERFAFPSTRNAIMLLTR
jgi:ADP-ribose pyrophosphatase YjhB (NUDIX family)